MRVGPKRRRPPVVPDKRGRRPTHKHWKEVTGRTFETKIEVQQILKSIRPITIRFFRKAKPRCIWFVPQVTVPLYWFDRYMLKKKLISAVPPDVFVADGHRFRVIAQDEREIGDKKYTRWLVYEEHKEYPDNGRP